MGLLTMPLILFLSFAAVFVVIGVFLKRAPANARLTEGTLVRSLAAANLSFSGAVLAVLYVAGYYRIWGVVMPVAFAAAIYLLYRAKRGSGADGPQKLTRLNELFGGSGRSNFALYYGISWVFFLAILIGWELFVASQVLRPVLFPNGTVVDQFLIAFIILGTISIYTYLGGAMAILKSDTFQLLLGLGVCALVTSNWAGNHAAFTKAQLVPAMPIKDVAAFACAILLVNVAFQVPNRLYWNYIEIAEAKSISVGRVLAFGTLIPCGVWMLLLALGATFSGAAPYPDLVRAPALWQQLVLIAAVVGFSFSTVDSLLLSAGMTVAEIKGIYSAAPAPSDVLAQGNTRTTTISLVGIGALVATFLLIQYVKNVFESFLSISGAMAAFAPVVLRPIYSKVMKYKDGAAHAFFALFLLSGLLQFGLFLVGLQGYTTYVVLATFACAFTIEKLGADLPEQK